MIDEFNLQRFAGDKIRWDRLDKFLSEDDNARRQLEESIRRAEKNRGKTSPGRGPI